MISDAQVATSPAQLMMLFAERAGNGDDDGLVALYEPDAVFEPDSALSPMTAPTFVKISSATYRQRLSRVS